MDVPRTSNAHWHTGFNKENNKKSPKFKVRDHVRSWKYKNIFAKGYVANWSEENFVIKKVKNTLPWVNAINDLNGEEFNVTFYKQIAKKRIKESWKSNKKKKR